MSSADTDDTRFLTDLADRLYTLPGVEAVTLGGSRAEGTHRVDSDWDLALYPSCSRVLRSSGRR